jgi:hypothetical protein
MDQPAVTFFTEFKRAIYVLLFAHDQSLSKIYSLIICIASIVHLAVIWCCSLPVYLWYLFVLLSQSCRAMVLLELALINHVNNNFKIEVCLL